MLDFNLYRELRADVLKTRLEIMAMRNEKTLHEAMAMNMDENFITGLMEDSLKEQQNLEEEILCWEKGYCPYEPK